MQNFKSESKREKYKRSKKWQSFINIRQMEHQIRTEIIYLKLESNSSRYTVRK